MRIFAWIYSIWLSILSLFSRAPKQPIQKEVANLEEMRNRRLAKFSSGTVERAIENQENQIENEKKEEIVEKKEIPEKQNEIVTVEDKKASPVRPKKEQTKKPVAPLKGKAKIPEEQITKLQNSQQLKNSQEIPIKSEEKKQEQSVKEVEADPVKEPEVIPLKNSNLINLEYSGENKNLLSDSTENLVNQFGLFVSRILPKILKFTLEGERGTDSLFYIPNFACAIQNSGEIINETHLDLILLEILELKKNKSNVDYLIECYRDSYSLIRTTKPLEKKEFLNSLNNRLISYFISLFDDNSSFSGNFQANTQNFVTKLSEYQFPTGFLAKLNEELQARGKIQQFYNPVLLQLESFVKQLDFTKQVGSLSNCLAFFTSDPNLIELLVNSPSFLAQIDVNGKVIENYTLLGSFLRFGCSIDERQIAPEALTAYQSFSSLSRPQIQNISNFLMKQLESIQSTVFSSMKSIVKSSPHAKEKLISWFIQAIHSNKDAGKLHYDPAFVSSDSFRCNVSLVLLQFCLPFLHDSSAIKKIVPTYYQSKKRIDVSTETQIVVVTELPSWVDKRNMDNIEKWKNQNPNVQIDESDLIFPDSFGFTTECFFLTARALHLGVIPLMTRLKKIIGEYQKLKERIKQIEGTPAGQNPMMIQQMKKVTEMAELQIEVLTVHLLDQNQLKMMSEFYIFLSKWLVYQIDPNNQGFPLPPPSVSYATLPEFLIEDMTNFFNFLLPFSPKIAYQLNLSELLPIIVYLVGSPPHCKNPYLRAHLVRILSDIILETERSRSTLIYTIFNSLTDKIVLNNLASVMMTFYVQVEVTGSHTQFYDKFNIRHDLQTIFKHMWQVPSLQDTIVAFSKSSQQDFLKFISLVLNDANYLLEEALKYLHEAKTTEEQLRNRNDPDADYQQMEAEHARREGAIKSFLQLAKETIHLLSSFTQRIISPFLLPEVIDRIPGMINYYFVELAEKAETLLVDNPEKYQFNPDQLLGQLVDVYLNLNNKTFIDAVGREGRSYKHSTFVKVANILRSSGIRNGTVIRKFMEFTEKVEASKQQDAAQNDLEIPEEFEDPLMGTLMHDPVRLPCGNIVDRAVIKQQFLLNGEYNPFNRQPLKESDLIPDDELKQRIDEWKRENKYRE